MTCKHIVYLRLRTLEGALLTDKTSACGLPTYLSIKSQLNSKTISTLIDFETELKRNPDFVEHKTQSMM
jgi:hypothetical protein